MLVNLLKTERTGRYVKCCGIEMTLDRQRVQKCAASCFQMHGLEEAIIWILKELHFFKRKYVVSFVIRRLLMLYGNCVARISELACSKAWCTSNTGLYFNRKFVISFKRKHSIRSWRKTSVLRQPIGDCHVIPLKYYYFNKKFVISF